MIVVNFKTYKQAAGYRALRLSNICREVSGETGVRIVVVPQIADLRSCVESGVDAWTQHVDAVEDGKTTGWISVEDVEEAGARGTILNHSEHRLDFAVLSNTMRKISTMAFESCVCVESTSEASVVAGLNPDYIAYEPLEFIGSEDKSVSSERPDIIEEVVKSVRFPVLVGAGIKSAKDVLVSRKLGAWGILVSSSVVLADEPETVLRELAGGFKMEI